MSEWSAQTPRPPHRLWFAILGAPIAWGIQGLMSWIIAEEACLGAQRHAAFLSQTALRWLEIGISSAALVVAIAAVTISTREWRSSPNREMSSAKTMDRSRFLEAVAVLVSFSFALGILWLGLGTFWLPVCERMR